MGGLHTDSTGQVVFSDRPLCRICAAARYELGHDVSPAVRVAAALTELARAI